MIYKFKIITTLYALHKSYDENIVTMNFMTNNYMNYFHN